MQVAALMAILDLHSAVTGSQAAAKAELVARPAALNALCLLCQAGTHIARRLLAEGRHRHLAEHVIIHPSIYLSLAAFLTPGA